MTSNRQTRKTVQQILAETPKTDEGMVESALFLGLIAPTEELAYKFGQQADRIGATLDEATIERCKERALQRADAY